MSVKSCEKLDKSKVALTIEADAAAFEAAINKAYLKQRAKISVPGFRPGKAPRKMIESMYGAEVFYEEAVNILLPDAYEDAVKEQELKVVGYPEVELESCGKDGVVFKCTVAVYPEVTLGQYKGLEAPKAEVNVTDEDVDNRLNEMADRNSRLGSVERVRVLPRTATPLTSTSRASTTAWPSTAARARTSTWRSAPAASSPALRINWWA